MLWSDLHNNNKVDAVEGASILIRKVGLISEEVSIFLQVALEEKKEKGSKSSDLVQLREAMSSIESLAKGSLKNIEEEDALVSRTSVGSFDSDKPEIRSCKDKFIYEVTFIGNNPSSRLVEFFEEYGRSKTKMQPFFEKLISADIEDGVAWFMANNLEWAICLDNLFVWNENILERAIDIAYIRKNKRGKKMIIKFIESLKKL